MKLFYTYKNHLRLRKLRDHIYINRVDRFSGFLPPPSPSWILLQNKCSKIVISLPASPTSTVPVVYV